MLKFLLIFLLTAVIVQFVFRDKSDAKSTTESKPKNPQPPKGKRPENVEQQSRKTVPLTHRKTRGEIIEPNEFISTYSLVYYDVQEKDTHYTYLTSQGYQGGGPSWLGIVYGILKIKDPQLLDRIEFDEEGDGLLVNGESRVDMEKISFWIDEVKADHKLMQRAIMIANIDGKME